MDMVLSSGRADPSTIELTPAEIDMVSTPSSPGIHGLKARGKLSDKERGLDIHGN